MKRFKNILVYMPHTIVDDNIVSWVSAITAKAQSDQVDFISSFQGYENLMSEPEWKVFSEGISKEWFQKSPFTKMNTEVNYRIYRRPGLTAVLENMVNGEYDLIILPKEHQEGISFVERVVRKSTTGVLLIPKNTEPDLSSIMLSVDFGDLTKQSLDWSEAFSSISETPSSMKALHIMQMPTQSRALAMMDPELVRGRMYSSSVSQLDDLIDQNAKDPATWEKLVAEHPLPSVQILEEAKNHGASLLVIGSHGKNSLSTALLGGQSVDIIRECKIPLLVVKKKNETLKFVKQLLGID